VPVFPCEPVGFFSPIPTGSHGITVNADITDAEFEALGDHSPEMIILPGGMPGTTNLEASPIVRRAITDASACGAWIAAICAAPSILGKMNLLYGKEAICFPGFEEALIGATISEHPVVKDGKIITAKGMGVALPFGLELVACFKGKAFANRLKKSVMATTTRKKS